MEQNISVEYIQEFPVRITHYGNNSIAHLVHYDRMKFTDPNELLKHLKDNIKSILKFEIYLTETLKVSNDKMIKLYDDRYPGNLLSYIVADSNNLFAVSDFYGKKYPTAYDTYENRRPELDIDVLYHDDDRHNEYLSYDSILIKLDGKVKFHGDTFFAVCHPKNFIITTDFKRIEPKSIGRDQNIVGEQVPELIGCTAFNRMVASKSKCLPFPTIQKS